MGANVLRELGVDLPAVRAEVEQLVNSGGDPASAGKLPMVSRAKVVIEYSIEEARSLGHNYVGTEHFVLGILREQDGVAARVLMGRGVTVDAAREQLLSTLNAQSGTPGVVGDLPSNYPVWSYSYHEGERIRRT